MRAPSHAFQHRHLVASFFGALVLPSFATAEESPNGLGFSGTVITAGQHFRDDVARTTNPAWTLKYEFGCDYDPRPALGIRVRLEGGVVEGGEDTSTDGVGIFSLNETTERRPLLLSEFFVVLRSDAVPWSFTVGRVACDGWFDANAVAGDETEGFVATPFVHAATVPFPENGWGAQWRWEHTPGAFVSGGIADAAAIAGHSGFSTVGDRFFSAIELGWSFSTDATPGCARFMVWSDEKARGIAVSAEHAWNKRFSWFARAGASRGVAPGEVETALSAGVRWTAPFGRAHDTVGLAWIGAQVSDETGRDTQTLVEAYYRWDTPGGFAVSAHAHRAGNLGDAARASWVASVRTVFAF